jgi:hypothetical protein
MQAQSKLMKRFKHKSQQKIMTIENKFEIETISEAITSSK